MHIKKLAKKMEDERNSRWESVFTLVIEFGLDVNTSITFESP